MFDGEERREKGGRKGTREGQRVLVRSNEKYEGKAFKGTLPDIEMGVVGGEEERERETEVY